MSFVSIDKTKLATIIASVVLSVFLVALYVSGASLVDTDSVGVGTTTVGAGLYVQDDFVSMLSGDVYIYGQLNLPFLVSTSTTNSSFAGALGIGTTTPGGTGNIRLAVLDDADIAGLLTVESHIETSYFLATSTTATSTLSSFGSNLASTTIVIDGASGRMAIGTSVVADSDVVATTLSNDPALTISGQGSANNATGTLYIAGEGGNGGQIVLQGSNGLSSRCVSLVVNTGAVDVGGSGSDANTLIIAKVVSCPR